MDIYHTDIPPESSPDSMSSSDSSVLSASHQHLHQEVNQSDSTSYRSGDDDTTLTRQGDPERSCLSGADDLKENETTHDDSETAQSEQTRPNQTEFMFLQGNVLPL